MIKIVIFIFTFMTAVDISISATIMPQVISALGQMELYPWINSAYLMAFFIATPIFGKISDYFGCKKATFGAIIIFALGALLSGLATSMQELIFFRFIQGIGARGLANTSSVMVAKLCTEDHKRAYMQGVLSTIWAFASIVGPSLAVFLSAQFSFRAVFFLHIPLCLIALPVMALFQEKRDAVSARFDVLSAFLFCTSSMILFFITAKQTPLFLSDPRVKYSLGACALILLAALLARCWKSPSPLLPLKLLEKPHIAICIFLGLVSGICITMSHGLISLFVQGVLRLSMKDAAHVIMATSLGWAVGSFGTGVLLRRFDLRTVFFVAVGILLFGFTAIGRAANGIISLSYFVVFHALLGMGLGALIAATICGMQKMLETNMLGRGMSFLSVVRSLGTTTGAALSGFLQFFYFRKALVGFNNGRVSEVLLQAPEKFLSKDFAQAVEPEVLSQLCDCFAGSICDVFFVPMLLLGACLPLVFLLRKKQEGAGVVRVG